MKTKYLIGCLFSAFALASCSDVVEYKDNLVDKFASNGAPTITAIYDAGDVEGEPISEGVLNEMIVLKGQNLSHVTKCTFNGLEVDPRDIYAESGRAYVRIPRKIPETVTNQLVYETEKGATTMDFPIGIPSVELEGLENEFVLQGGKVRVKGDYFDLYGFTKDPDAEKTASIVITNAEENYTQEIPVDSITEVYMGIVIPKNCPDNSIITFSWNEMGQAKSKSIPYRMSKALIYGNFDGDLGWWNDWGKGLVEDGSSAGAPESLGYQYLRITGNYDVWSWNSTGFGANCPVSVSDPENYVLKFEVNTNSGNPYYSYGDNGYTGAKNGGYNITLAGGGTRCQFDPIGRYGISNTYGEWITVSIPLTEALGGANLPEEGAWLSTELVLQPNSGDSWAVDHCFGQFRIEPKNY